MLQLLALTGSIRGYPMQASVAQAAGAPPEDAQRIGVYVLAGIFGLLVTGIVACLGELRRDRADSRLRKALERQDAAPTALRAVARSMHRRAG